MNSKKIMKIDQIPKLNKSFINPIKKQRKKELKSYPFNLIKF